MKIIYNEITWYSKLLAMLLFASLPFIGFYFGIKYVSSILPKGDIADSGVSGVVLLRPQCPVQIQGNEDCQDKPYQTQIEVFKKGNEHVYKNINTNQEGYFYIQLSPGIYMLKPKGGDILPSCGQQEVKVVTSQV